MGEDACGRPGPPASAAYAVAVASGETTVEPSATCRAPHVALRFSPDGSIHACCANDTFPLGRVGEQSLHDAWHGPALRRLRRALDEGDFSLGCQDCGRAHALGERLATHAEAYDRYPQPTAPLPWPKRVEFALSNTCNLRCVMCNGDLSSAIRAQVEHRPPLRSAYDDAFFDELREVLPHVEVAVFIGGEPFLSRECRRVWDLMIELGVTPETHVTTNGTVWDDRVERTLHALRMNVAVSLDGVTADVNDSIRLGSSFAEVVANRDRFLAATRSYGASFCLNHCLVRDNWHELPEFLLEADRLDVDVHVIPVYHPPRHSLFALPPDELARVGADLRARRPALGRNRAAWESTLGHLDTVASGAGTLTPVVLGPATVEAVDEDAVDALRAELSEWSGQRPLVVRAPEGVIEGVDVPPWADGLDLPGLVGRPLSVLDEEVAPRLGPRRDLELERGGAGYHVVRYRHGTAGGDVDFRSVVIPDWGVLTATPAAVLVPDDA